VNFVVSLTILVFGAVLADLAPAAALAGLAALALEVFLASLGAAVFSALGAVSPPEASLAAFFFGAEDLAGI